jgi:hypothetical protein
MGSEYFIIGMDSNGAVAKEEVLEIFSPYWTEKEENYYFLDYGKEIREGYIVHNECHFNIDFYEDNLAVKGVTIFKPCSDIKLEKAVFQLIHQFPMIVTYPVEPLLVITANQKCVEIIKEEHPDLLPDLTIVSSFEKYNSIS